MILDAYKTLGGVHPETAAVNNILAFHGVTAPHTGKPFTEALLLGIGGGLGSMFILWEFEKHDYPSIVLGRNELNETAALYLELHDLWRGLAQAALPERVDIFRETRELLDRREAIRQELGGEGLEDIRPLNDRLHALKGELNDAFPLNGSETAALFAEIRDRLEGIYRAEIGALASLRSSGFEYN